MTRFMAGLCIFAVAVFANPVNAQFSDNFDGYVTGQNMHGINGWRGWNNDPTFTAFTSSAQTLSAPNSIAIGGLADLINELGTPTSGVWEFTIQQYIPTGLTGDTYFIMLNTYGDTGSAGGDEVEHWSVELVFHGATGRLNDDFDGTIDVPIIFDQWVEIKMVIDLTLDNVDQYYDGVLLGSGPWSTRGSAGTGLLEIGAVDLYSANASEIYYDNLVLQPAPPLEVVPDLFTVTRGDYVSGGLPELAGSDNLDVSLRRRAADLQSRTEFEVMSMVPNGSPSSLGFRLEGSVFARSTVVQTVEFWNYSLGTWELIDTSNAMRLTDSTVTVDAGGDLTRFIDQLRLEVLARVHFESLAPRQNFASNTDQFVWLFGR